MRASSLDHTEATERVRALFISDVHLGTRASQDILLLDLLKRYEAEHIYLVGDIIDGWRLKRAGWFWPQTHNDVVQKLLRKVRKGACLTYVPGNHDEFMRDFDGMSFGGIAVADRAVHEAADGRRYLVIHGDQFDLVVRHAVWLAWIGDGLYTLALWINGHLNVVRRRLGFSYWSLSAWAKRRVKQAVNYIGRFEDVLVLEARREDVDGVICGHIHHAALREIDGIVYVNTGDWVESCTAAVEHLDGRFEIVDFTRPAGVAERAEASPSQPPALGKAA
jgi:UDP-2,3-diacylglucosamine pyrophosphatase LpxH